MPLRQRSYQAERLLITFHKHSALSKTGATLIFIPTNLMILKPNTRLQQPLAGAVTYISIETTVNAASGSYLEILHWMQPFWFCKSLSVSFTSCQPCNHNSCMMLTATWKRASAPLTGSAKPVATFRAPGHRGDRPFACLAAHRAAVATWDGEHVAATGWPASTAKQP